MNDELFETNTFETLLQYLIVWEKISRVCNYKYDVLIMKPERTLQRRIQNPIKYLQWSLFTKIVNG